MQIWIIEGMSSESYQSVSWIQCVCSSEARMLARLAELESQDVDGDYLYMVSVKEVDE